MFKIKNKYVLFGFLLFGIAATHFSGCASRSPYPSYYEPAQATSVSGASLSATGPRDIYHVVGPAETLWRISKTYDVDMNTLMRVNHIKDAAKIKKGTQLLIPNTRGPKPVIPLYPSAQWSHIVIHHTATHEGDAFSIDQIHHKRGFWNGLGYHFLINNGTHGKTDGQIQVGPRWIKQQNGAHANAAGMNETGIGVALVGNFSEQGVSDAELDALVFLVKTLQSYYDIPNQNVIGHKHVPGKNTECPGNYFPWMAFKSRLR